MVAAGRGAGAGAGGMKSRLCFRGELQANAIWRRVLRVCRSVGVFVVSAACWMGLALWRSVGDVVGGPRPYPM